ncbi:maleate cis-trans isomerase [Nesterenkonia sp. LB17]|uniref:maleate cis-trans isomerase family protein n=1 Tax=unclassified Nesterenkonia TaxID=2629769 RepID=UPI001F4CCDBA|nr:MULTISPECIES: maleate cis-trans isomerase [unclassified Nesterenkonia]MCH8559430.1 maleate cis-trans isomerase [Nesterenkonia sp. DZ6]MCH8564878.1 maleate cis-trans isomerase [Nesterenkonia sp. LB17]
MHTLAILYPGYSAEDEFPALEQLIPDTSFRVIHTWEGRTDHDVDALLALGSRNNLVPSAEKARELSPDSVMWACTSGSFVYGRDGCREQAGWIEEAAGVPSSSTSLAFAEAVHHLGLSRVAVAATYPEEVASHFMRFLGQEGIAVSALSTYDVPSGEDAGLLDAEWVLEAARAADLTGAQCLLIPDTALHTIAVLPRLEEALGVPVLTANQVTAWQGLRLAGHPARVQGLGALFSR